MQPSTGVLLYTYRCQSKTGIGWQRGIRIDKGADFSVGGFFLTFKLAGTVSIIAAAWSIWTARKSPQKMLELNDEIARAHRLSGRHPNARDRATLILIVIGFGVFIYGGVYAGLSWVPAGWGSHDEDGNWNPLRGSVASIAAVVGAVFFLQFVLDYCRRKLKEQWRLEASDGAGGD